MWANIQDTLSSLLSMNGAVLREKKYMLCLFLVFLQVRASTMLFQGTSSDPTPQVPSLPAAHVLARTISYLSHRFLYKQILLPILCVSSTYMGPSWSYSALPLPTSVILPSQMTPSLV